MLTRKNTRGIPYVFSDLPLEESKKHYTTDPENPFWRMYKPEKAGHLLITETPENKENGLYFQQFENLEDPSRFRYLCIDEVKKQKDQYEISARTPNGTKMQSKRCVKVSRCNGITGSHEKSTLLLFSPVRTNNNPLSKVHVKKSLNTDEVELQNLKRKIEKIHEETPQETIETPAKRLKRKSSGSIIVPAERRDRRLENAKANKTVMRKSAAQELLDLLSHIESHQEDMAPEKFALLKLLATSFKAEWLHCLAYSLTPDTMDPQVKENLGAAPKWINTLMMPLEMLASYFAALYPGMVSVKPEFTMVDDSNVIDEIKYEVTIQRDQELVTVSQSISALALPNRANWPSTTDSIQLKHVIECLMEDKQDDQNTRSSPRLGRRHGNGAGAF